MKYFAYGSNLCMERLRRRKVTSATRVAIGRLTGHRLHFHKQSADGSGKCNAYFTGNTSDEVVGVVFEIGCDEKRVLDLAEGLGRGYEEKSVSITTSNATLECFTYVAESFCIDWGLAPYSWYLDIVAAGAREQGLPVPYLQANILNVEAIPDPDTERDNRERECLTS